MSLETFVANVTSLPRLAEYLRQAARSELGAAAEASVVEQRANRLLVETMLWVGINPASEQEAWDRIFAALRGDLLNDQAALHVVEYVAGQMIAKPKGALAEWLARLPCAQRITELQQAGILPSQAEYCASTWSKRLKPSVEGVHFGEWRAGADGIVLCRPNGAPACDLRHGHSLSISPETVFVLAVVEIKARRTLAAGEPRRQLDRHLARLTQGLQVRTGGR